MTGAVIYGYLQGLTLEQLSLLANAAGAVKVQKRGTGRNLPTMDEIRQLLIDNKLDPGLLP
jgi:sugar/nucleoside kinase (ribokinase family)